MPLSSILRKGWLQPALPFKAAWTAKARAAIVVSSLLLVGLVGFLVYSNFQSQVALRESALHRFRMDLEKRGASLDYFFSERKYDLNALSLSREINTFFSNKSMGMSEQYGLKVNLFMIQQILQKTIDDKLIQRDKIYTRFALLNTSAEYLVDTALKTGTQTFPARQIIQNTENDTSQVYISFEDGNLQIIIASPCFHKGQRIGTLVGWLDCATFFDHLVNLDDNIELSGSALTDGEGRLFSMHESSTQHLLSSLTPEYINNLPTTSFSFFPLSFKGDNQEMLVARLPLLGQDLGFISWVPVNQIVNSLTPWQLITGMGILATAVLASLATIIWFTTQNLILKSRYYESEKQHGLLAAKNLQLKDEMEKREQAERELESQRTLHMRSDRLRSLGEMAAGIAHELNQPLVGVRGYAELLIDSIENGVELSKDRIFRSVSTIVQQVDRMVHIINHVRLFAREAGSVEVSRVDLNDVVRSATSMLAAQFNSHGLFLEQDLTPQAVPVIINPYSVEEVIINLLSNARHSIEQRKESEEHAAYKPCVQMSTRSLKSQGKNEVLLTITDNGAGIPLSIADRVFDPFFTTKAPDKGTGLGLSICKTMVESFQGKIQFISTENEGTRFEITFPESPPEDSGHETD